MSKGLTFSIIFQAGSLNYGEGFGNISELKKITRGDGTQYTFASRQCLRYDIVRLGNAIFDWNLEVVDKSKGTLQFKEDCTIEDSQEMDLFGYMKTVKSEGSIVRAAPVRLSHAISLEAYKNDMEFLSNKGFADRVNENSNLASIEQHYSFYTYSVTIDIDKIGVDLDIELDKQTRYKRLSELLEIIKILNRNIRGRQENLSPLFIIGGLYEITSPVFLGRIKLNVYNGKNYIDINPIKEALNLKICDKSIFEDTYIGIVKGIFDNQDEIISLTPDRVMNIQDFFEVMKEKLKDYYGV